MVVGSLEIQTDVLIIGGGPGGYVAAIRAAQLGKEVIVVEEQKNLGGVCLNTGCIPTKSVIRASNFFHTIDSLKEMGINIEKYSVDISKMKDWKNNIIEKLAKGIKNLFDKHQIEVIPGRAEFIDTKSVRISGKTDVNKITFKKCIIATGSSPLEIEGFDLDEENIIGSAQALELTQIPKKLVIIGGGYIGTEMGTVFGKLGSEVHIIEYSDRLISALDKEIVDVVAKKLKNFNITAHLNSKAIKYTKDNEKILVEIEKDGKKETFDCDKVLVVVGRKPNSKIGLENANIKVNDKGFIVVDSQMKTTTENIFAVGDVVGQPMLAHKAFREGKVAAEVICDKPSAFDNKVIPFVVFNDPELCSVGLTEEQAKEKNKDFIVGKFPFAALGKSATMGVSDGFIKVIAQKDTKIVLGVHAAGPHVSEIVGEATLAIEMGATIDDLILTIHPHPTVSESLPEAAEAAVKEAIHIFQGK